MTLCTDWITGEDVAACCAVEGASDTSVFETAAIQAQELLFEISGRQFNGICEQTVRPCWSGCGCGWQVLSRGYVVWNPNLAWGGPWFGGWTCDDNSCGCAPLSKVPLAGYVQEIVEVKIADEVVDPATYRVDRHRWLVRTRLDADDFNNAAWPGCQDLDLPLDEPGTWSVTYTYGRDVPEAGRAAAVQLACEIYKACAGQECALPAGTQRVTRLGVTIEKVPFTQWGWTTGKRAGQIKGWNTGLAAVDMFLNAYNPGGLPRVPVIWSPASHLRFPIPVTETGT